MKKFMNIRLPAFVVAVSVVFLVLMLQTFLALYVNYQQLEQDLRNELFREEISDAMQFQGILEYLLQKNEFEQLQEEVAVMSIEPSTLKAVVMGSDHIVLASTAYADRGKIFEELFPGLVGTGYQTLLDEAQRTQQYRTLRLDEMDCWVLFQPIVFESYSSYPEQSNIGFLVKKVDLAWVERQARSGLLGRFLPTLFPLLLGAILFAIIAYLLHTRSLAALSQLVDDISVRGVEPKNQESDKKELGFFQFFSGRSNRFIERKQQELTSAVERIALREQGLSLMLDSIGDAVIVTDTEARIIRMNPIAENLTAWNFDEAKGRLLEEVFPIVHSFTRKPLVNPVEEVLATARVVNLKRNTLLLSRDGTEYQVSDSAAPIKNELGDVVGVILVFRDVTEFFRLQQKVHERNQMLEAVMSNMPPLLYVKDLDGKFIDVNRSFEIAFGVSNEAIVGKTDFDLFGKDEAGYYQGEDNKVAETGSTLTWTNEAEGVEGIRRYLTTKFPLYDLDENIYATCGLSTDITAEMQLITQLEESKNHLQAIIDHAPAIIYTRDLEGKFLLANKNLGDVLGLPVENIVGQNSYDIMDMESADQHLAHEEEIVETKVPHEYIETFSQEGEVHHFFSIKYPLFDKNNEVYAVGGISTDITERHNLEQAMRNSEQHMRLYRDQNPQAVIEWDADMRIVDWNPAAEKLFGFSKAEALGRRAKEFIIPAHLFAYAKEQREAMQAMTGAESFVLEAFTKTGEKLYCHWQSTSITDESGGMIGAVSVVNDISEQQRIERELRTQEVEQHQILNHVVDGIITIDQKGTVLSFNQPSENLFGYDAEEVLGQNISMLMDEPDRTQHDSYLQRYMATNTARIIGFNRVVIAKRKSGDTFSMRLSVAELPVSNTGMRRFVGSCLDVTEIEQHELQLQQAQKMEALGKLTGGIAHDYNNMLGVILGYVELMLEKPLEPDLCRYTEQIQKAGQRGASLTNKLLAFSKTKATEPEAVHINEFLLDEKEMLGKTLTPRIALVLELDDALWPVWVDKGELEDVLLNLSINAMHAMDGVGELKLTTGNVNLNNVDANELGVPVGQYIQLVVDDTGAGMNADVSSRIFDPFFTTKGEQGTGLGLSQVYGFMQRCHGVIRVDSTPSLGSRFEMYFPRHLSNSTDTQISTANEEIDFRGSETILIVDDEPAIREVTQAILSAKGYVALSVASGDEALELLKNIQVDLVISDVIMPEMDGYQLAREIKLQFPDVKIQLVSGYTGDYLPDMLDIDLQKNLLVKPVESRSLFLRMRELLSGR